MCCKQIPLAEGVTAECKKGIPRPGFGQRMPAAIALLVCHLFFLGLDHTLYHISTHGTVLSGSQIAVVTLLQRYAQLTGNLVLETIQRALCLRYGCAVVLSA